MPDEPLDVYADSFQMSYNPFGFTLNFALSDATPTAPGMGGTALRRVVTLRLSPETFKLMLMKSVRSVKQIERNNGTSIAIPIPVLNMEDISPEDWQMFWSL